MFAAPSQKPFDKELGIDEGRYETFLRRELNLQRSEERLCDVTLMVRGRRFPCHRCVLSATCPYFRTMFEQHGFIESTSNEIELHDMEAEVLKCILDYMYTGKLALDENNVCELFAVADQMLLTEARQLCIQFLSLVLKKLSSVTMLALKALKLAETYNEDCLYSIADDTIGKYFTYTPEEFFIDLPKEEILIVLKNPQISGKEDQLLQTAWNWLHHDKDLRKQHAEEILSCIRFPLLTNESLVTISENEIFVKNSEKLQTLIRDAVNYKMLPWKQSQMQSLQTTPRGRLNMAKVIFCLIDTGRFYWYNSADNNASWQAVAAPLHSPRYATDVVFQILSLQGRVYASGHLKSDFEAGRHTLCDVQVYDILTNTWTRCALPTEQDNCILITCNSKLYACSRKSVAVYDIDRDLWKVVCRERLQPYELVASDAGTLHFLNLDNGCLQLIHTERDYNLDTVLFMSAGISSEVEHVCKLADDQVLVSLRTPRGMTRSIINLKMNTWQDADIFSQNVSQPFCPGVDYPHCLNPSKLWYIMYTKLNAADSLFYVLSSEPAIMGTGPDFKNRKVFTEGVLPFFKVDTKRNWQPLSGVPFRRSDRHVSVCMGNNDSMAVYMP